MHLTATKEHNIIRSRKTKTERLTQEHEKRANARTKKKRINPRRGKTRAGLPPPPRPPSVSSFPPLLSSPHLEIQAKPSLLPGYESITAPEHRAATDNDFPPLGTNLSSTDDRHDGLGAGSALSSTGNRDDDGIIALSPSTEYGSVLLSPCLPLPPELYVDESGVGTQIQFYVVVDRAVIYSLSLPPSWVNCPCIWSWHSDPTLAMLGCGRQQIAYESAPSSSPTLSLSLG
jgi:hypothetical protein